MNEFNEGSRFYNSVPVIPAGPAGQDHHQGPQALTATGNDVVRDLVYQGDGTFEAGTDYTVNAFEVRSDQRPDFFEGHCSWEQSVAGGIHDEPHILADAGAGENGEGAKSA